MSVDRVFNFGNAVSRYVDHIFGCVDDVFNCISHVFDRVNDVAGWTDDFSVGGIQVLSHADEIAMSIFCAFDCASDVVVRLPVRLKSFRPSTTLFS